MRHSMNGSLINLRILEFIPKTVIDVGAALGTFCLYEVFPEAHHLLIEPLVENAPHLEKICTALESAEFIIAAATTEPGEVTLEVSNTLVHSSIQEKYTPKMKAEPDSQYLRQIPGISLDQICQDKQLKPPYLIKLDIDGQEVEVLKGATKILKNTEYIIIECSLFGQVHDVIDFMKRHGFVIYDIVDLSARHFDHTLWQCDIAFVKANSFLRKNQSYWAADSQNEDDEAIERYRDSRMMNYRQQHIDAAEHLYGKFNSNLDLDVLKSQFQLRESNIVVFPNWKVSEEELQETLCALINALGKRVDCERLTLLLDITGVEETMANLALSSACMQLVMADIDDSYSNLQISFLSQLNPRQWQALLKNVQSRIVLPQENRRAIAFANAQHLPGLTIEEASKK